MNAHPKETKLKIGKGVKELSKILTNIPKLLSKFLNLLNICKVPIAKTSLRL